MFRKPWMMAPALWLAVACSAPQQGTPVAVDQAAPTPRYGGVLNVPVSNDPTNWDMTISKSVPNSYGAAMAYGTLLTYKTGPGIDYNEGILAAKLAERWEVATDARTFIFHLRKGVKFADTPPLNRRELTAADVKWSYEYGSRTGEFQDKSLPPSEYNFMFEGVDRIETPDRYTVAVHFKTPFAPFINYAGADWNVIMPPELYGLEGKLQDNLLGIGPYRLNKEASQKGTRWVFHKEPNYWEDGKPYLDQVRWLVITDDATENAAFQARQIDLLQDVASGSAEDVKRANSNAMALQYQTGYPRMVALNHRKPPLNDVRIRKALALSIDRDELNKVMEKGKGEWQMPAVFTGYFTQDEIRKLMPYNPAEAKRLVTEAGYPDGVPVEIQYAGLTEGQAFVTMLELMQTQVKKGGINLEMKNTERSTYTRNLRVANFEFIIRSGSTQRWDPDGALAYFDPKASRNWSGTDDPALTEIIEAQRREADPTKRRELIRKAAARVVEQAHSLGFYTEALTHFWHPYVKNYYRNWNLSGINVADVWVDK